MAAPVLEAVEAVESHLHPPPSFEVADPPFPKGQEEIWRFSPLRRMRPPRPTTWSARSAKAQTRSPWAAISTR